MSLLAQPDGGISQHQFIVFNLMMMMLNKLINFPLACSRVQEFFVYVFNFNSTFLECHEGKCISVNWGGQDHLSQIRLRVKNIENIS